MMNAFCASANFDDLGVSAPLPANGFHAENSHQIGGAFGDHSKFLGSLTEKMKLNGADTHHFFHRPSHDLSRLLRKGKI